MSRLFDLDHYQQKLMDCRPLAFVWYVARSFQRHQNGRAAYYLAFTSLFAIVPTMTVVYAILGLIPELKAMESKIQRLVFDHFIPASGSQLESYLHEFAQQAANLTGIGLVMLFATSVLMLRTLEAAFNTIWHVIESRRGVNGLLLYWALLSLGPVTVAAVLALSTYLLSHKLLYDFIPLVDTQQVLWQLVPIALSTFGFSLAYIVIPNTKVPVLHGLIGGLFTALLVDGARRTMAWLITLFPTYQLVYGAFAVVPVFLLWVLVTWVIVLLGAEVVQSLSSFKFHKAFTKSVFGNILVVLEALYREQAAGRMVDEVVLVKDLPWIPAGQWEQLMVTLTELQIIQRTESGFVSLTRDLHKYSLAQLFQDLFRDSINLDMATEQSWQQQVKMLYGEGLNACMGRWTVSLADIFDGVLTADQDASQSHLS